jgi:hypothetical protein
MQSNNPLCRRDWEDAMSEELITITTVSTQAEFDAAIDEMNRKTRDWTMRAARGECGWVCADCSYSFPDRMPDQCAHGDERCTKIIARDKAAAETGSSK